MTKFKLFTDSTADLSEELVRKIGVTVIPTEFFIGGKRYLDFPDEREMSKKQFFDIVRTGEMPTTAVIPPSRFSEYFEPDVKAGVPILYIVFSTGLTTTYQNAVIARSELLETYPGADIRIVDSRAASLGEGGLVYFAGMMQRDGRSRDEVADWLEANRLRLNVWFTVDDLSHLRRGGRISATAAAVGGVLHIKPLIHMDDEGKLVPAEKARGRKAALEALLDKAKRFATSPPPADQTMFVVHADCPGDADWLKNKLLKDVGAKEVFVTMMGPVVGTHTGPGCVGFLYFGEKR